VCQDACMPQDSVLRATGRKNYHRQIAIRPGAHAIVPFDTRTPVLCRALAHGAARGDDKRLRGDWNCAQTLSESSRQGIVSIRDSACTRAQSACALECGLRCAKSVGLGSKRCGRAPSRCATTPCAYLIGRTSASVQARLSRSWRRYHVLRCCASSQNALSGLTVLGQSGVRRLGRAARFKLKRRMSSPERKNLLRPLGSKAKTPGRTPRDRVRAFCPHASHPAWMARGAPDVAHGQLLTAE
jgi:hypothetical protein